MTTVLTKKVGGSNLQNIFAGCITTFVLISLFAGPGTAMGIYAGSIICTAGVSLVLWIPLWLAIGSIVMQIMNHFLTNKTAKPGDDGGGNQTPTLTNEQKALTDYIKQSKSKGVDENNIFSLLKANGWAENAIHEAFGIVATHKES